MSNLFGYPEFDKNGEMILTTYDNEYSAMLMDVRVYSMKAGQTREFGREGEETAVLLLSGFSGMTADSPLFRACIPPVRERATLEVSCPLPLTA